MRTKVSLRERSMRKSARRRRRNPSNPKRPNHPSRPDKCSKPQTSSPKLQRKYKSQILNLARVPAERCGSLGLGAFATTFLFARAELFQLFAARGDLQAVCFD